MSYITDLPEHIGDFGTEFNYAVWTEDTTVTICNVNWDNSYRDIAGFNSRAELNTHIDSLATASIQLTDVSYVKTHEPIYLDIPFNVANKFNYLRASNPAQPIGGDEPRDFYYFILGVEHVAGNTTRFLLQLDVWQSFGYDVNIGNVYVEQGHVGIANENGFADYGHAYLTVPEGLDLGPAYSVIANRRKTYIDSNYDGTVPRYYTAIVTSITWETNSFGDEKAPHQKTAEGGMVDGMPSGATVYLVDGQVPSLMRKLRNYPWIGQGIQAMFAVPRLNAFRGTEVNTPISDNSVKVYKTGQGVISSAHNRHNMWNNWRNSELISNRLGKRYAHLKKFMTAPYTVIELTDYTGDSIIINPESWNSDNAEIYERYFIAPPSPRINVIPLHVSKGASSSQFINDSGILVDDGGEFANTSITISEFPQYSIVNDSGMLARASSAYSTRASTDSLGWSHQKTLAGNQLSYDQATAGINAANSMTDLANSTASAYNTQANQHSYNQARTSMAMGVGGGAILGATTGGVAGAAMGALGGAGAALNTAMNHNMSVDNNNINLAISQANNNASNRISGQQAEYVRDSNKSLADYAAKGDYAHSIASMNAASRDTNTINPASAGNQGGEGLAFTNGGLAITMKVKQVSGQAKRAIGEYWLRYGYAVNAFMKFPGLHVMEKFTYWRLSETYIHANIPESYKTTIRGIFEKGVTVWRNPSEIGMIDTADNTALKGIRY